MRTAFQVSVTDGCQVAAISALMFFFSGFLTYVLAQQDGVLVKESAATLELKKVMCEIEAVIPKEVKIVGFARSPAGYVLNMESNEAVHVSRAMRAIDNLPDLGSPELVGYTEYKTPSFVTILIKRENE